MLREAGVVDAGGKGFTLLLAAFLEVVDGRPMPEPAHVGDAARRSRPTSRGDDVAGPALRGHVPPRRARRVDARRSSDAWGALGDSIVVVGGDGIWNCHVHTNDIGAAVEAGIEAGRPHQIRVTDLFEQVEDEHEAELGRRRRRRRGDDAVAAAVKTAVVAVGVGNGVGRLLTSLGVQIVVAGGQSMNPSTAQILEAVEASRPNVIVLPNNKNIVPVAQQVDALTERRVEVIATTSIARSARRARRLRPRRRPRRQRRRAAPKPRRVRTGEVDAVPCATPSPTSARCSAGDWIAIDDAASARRARHRPTR